MQKKLLDLEILKFNRKFIDSLLHIDEDTLKKIG